MVLIKDITTKIKDVLNKNPQGMTIIQIARKTGINRNTVGRYLENLSYQDRWRCTGSG